MSQLKSSNPVRSDSQNVMDEAENVTVNRQSIPEFCEYVVNNYEFTTADWDAPVFPSVSENEIEDVVDFLMVGNAVNYCFNDLETGEKFAHEYIGTEWPGAFGMWSCLMDEMESNQQILNPEYLKNLDKEQVSDIFEPSNGVEIPMIETRVEKLNSVGTLMNEVGGTFWKLFEDGEVTLYGDDGVVSTLAESEAYRDVRTYEGSTVRFDKRSQLAVSMLYGKLLSMDYQFEISDMDEFTVFADYGIPAGLASHGVIEYSDELESRIQSQDVIDENTPEEVEIRSATVVSVEEIEEYLQSNYEVETKMPVLDYVLWSMRREAETNVHLTETTAY